MKRNSLTASLLRGSLGFATVSVAGFAVWAFAGRWFYKNVGETGLYIASTFVFILLSGLLLYPLIHGPNRLFRFYKVFIPAFLGYAIIWSACWFVSGFGVGEWLGPLFGCTIFALITGKLLSSTRSWFRVILFLFLAHSAGYFAGGYIHELGAHSAKPLFGFDKNSTALLVKLLWGICYGLGFGTGIGYTFHHFQCIAQETSGIKDSNDRT